MPEGAMPPASGLAPLRIAGWPLLACCTKAPRVYCNCASCIAICTRRPRPVVWRWKSAPRIPIASSIPVPVSPRVGPGLHGRPSRSPVIAIVPPQAWAIIVEGEVVLVGTALAEAFDLSIDEPRVERVQLLPAETEPFDRARCKILDKDIGALCHLLDEREAARGFEIDRDRFLIGVVDHEVIGVGIGLRAGAENPAGFAAFRILHLDDLGPEPGERLGPGRAC